MAVTVHKVPKLQYVRAILIIGALFVNSIVIRAHVLIMRLCFAINPTGSIDNVDSVIQDSTVTVVIVPVHLSARAIALSFVTR